MNVHIKFIICQYYNLQTRERIVLARAQNLRYIRFEFHNTIVGHGLWKPIRPPPNWQLRSVTLVLSFAQFEVHPCLTTPDVNS
jgi:hypothetical protein